MNHAVFEQGKNENEIILKPRDFSASDNIIINGRKIESEEGQVLQHKDSIIFGTNSVMVYLEKSDGKDLYEFDWETILTEYENIADEDAELEAITKCGEMGKLEEKFQLEKLEIEKNYQSQIYELQTKLNKMSENETNERSKIDKKRSELEAQLRKNVAQ